jgi:superfamily I DNA/RNA helicase
MSFQPTEQQQAIFDHLFIESGHLAVNAVAGAGKTSTLVRAAERPDDRIVLSSVHRAKGLEAERVWIYEPGIMPGNLLYVALTRSKSELYLVDHQVRRKTAFVDPLAWVRHAAGGGNRFDLTEKPERKAS